MAEGPNESRPASIGKSPFGPPAQPPLRIAHLMLWTAGSAVILAVYRGTSDSIDYGLPDAMRTVLNVHRVLSSTILGAALASVAVFVHRRLTRGTPFPVQPGHWLLFIRGLLVLITLPASAALALLESRWISDDGSRWAAPSIFSVGVQVLTYGTSVGALSWALRQLQAERRWRLLFWLELGLGVFNLLASLTVLVPWWPGSRNRGFLLMMTMVFVPTVWLVLAAVLDWRRRVRRDWLHWTGVVVEVSRTMLWLSTNLCLRLVS